MNRIKNVFEQVAEILIARIDGGELIAGDKLPSELALAEEFQVSRATVVKGLRILEERLYVSKTGRGGRRIVLAGNQAKKRSFATARKIVLVLPEEKEYFNSMEQELKKCCESVGYEYTLIRNGKDKGNFALFSEWIENNYDGALIMEHFPNETFDQNAYSLLRKAKFPFVMLCKPPRKLLCDSVSFDDYFASYQIVGSLYKYHCSEVIYVTKSSYNAIVRKERRAGYVDRIIRKGQKQEYIFDLDRASDVDVLEKYIACQRRKFAIVTYNNIVFKAIESILIKYEKKLGVDYECASFYEKDMGISKGEKLFYVPKEKIMRSAFQILYNKIESKTRSESVSHIIFSFQDMK